MSLSAAFWCRDTVSCFRICLDSAGLEDFAPCSTAHIDLSKGGQSHNAREKDGVSENPDWQDTAGEVLSGRPASSCAAVANRPYTVTICRSKTASLPWSCASYQHINQTKVRRFYCSVLLSCVLVEYFHNSEL